MHVCPAAADLVSTDAEWDAADAQGRLQTLTLEVCNHHRSKGAFKVMFTYFITVAMIGYTPPPPAGPAGAAVEHCRVAILTHRRSWNSDLAYAEVLVSGD